MADLNGFIDNRVAVVTFDGRFLVGDLKGSDQATNLILSNCEERVLSLEEPIEIVPLGLYLVRGDNVVVVGKMDQAEDDEVLNNQLKIEPMNPVVYH